ncbi:MAG: DUF1624 domain-containing protein, partial [Promethearchaeota archaeon]
MVKKRLKSLDLFRGLCICWMIFGHVSEWWLTHEAFVLIHYMICIIDAIGATGFLFISGISLTLSYRSKISRVKSTQDLSYKKLRLNYFLRAIFLFIVGFLYNIVDSIRAGDISLIWNWFILFTLPVSILLAWPLLKCRKEIKIIISIGILILDQFLYIILYPFQFEFGHPLSIIFYFLYHLPRLTPVIAYFPFFILGTVMADIIYENYITQEEESSKFTFFKKFLILSIVFGIILILLAFLAIPLPVITEDFLWHRRNIAWIIYAFGVLISFYPLLFYIKDIKMVKVSEKYRFFYYFSYYSFSIFLIHYVLFFLFNYVLNLLIFIPAIIITILIIGFGLRFIHMK